MAALLALGVHGGHGEQKASTLMLGKRAAVAGDDHLPLARFSTAVLVLSTVVTHDIKSRCS
jgi:hypothetical protein